MSEKLRGVVLVTIAYLVAIAAGAATVWGMQDFHPLVAAGVADVVATVVVFAFSVAFRNASFYDPYWSVIPMVLVVYWWMHPSAADGNEVRQWLVMGCVWFWGARLTGNWTRGWTGLDHEDWRYTRLRKEHPKIWWLTNFGGIHMFPTILVFLGLTGAWAAIVTPGPIGALDYLAAAVAVVATIIEWAADEQMWAFRQSNTDKQAFMKSGLWRYSRHPNYFGEQLFWVGIFIFAVAASPDNWWTVVGPVSMIILFMFISIPMMEKRTLAKRPAYADHIERTSACIPWFPK